MALVFFPGVYTPWGEKISAFGAWYRMKWKGKKMYLIAGLGNPGKEYAGSRHNVGFMTLDELADRYNIDVREKAHKALIGNQ